MKITKLKQKEINFVYGGAEESYSNKLLFLVIATTTVVYSSFYMLGYVLNCKYNKYNSGDCDWDIPCITSSLSASTLGIILAVTYGKLIKPRLFAAPTEDGRPLL